MPHPKVSVVPQAGVGAPGELLDGVVLDAGELPHEAQLMSTVAESKATHHNVEVRTKPSSV